MKLRLLPVRVEQKSGPFNLFDTIKNALRQNGVELREGDVIVVSSKFISMSQGRLVKLDGIVYGERAKKLARRYSIPPQLVELIMREAERVIGGVPRFMLTYKHSALTPNAGIDGSNVQDGFVVLPPEDPYEVAEVLRLKFLVDFGTRVGVLISDSGLMPGRRGTVGVAVGASGIEPVKDERGKKDLFGKPLTVTVRAIADELCSSAQLLMGEANESIPIVVARGDGIWELTERRVMEDEMVIDPDICVYLRGMVNGEGLRDKTR